MKTSKMAKWLSLDIDLENAYRQRDWGVITEFVEDNISTIHMSTDRWNAAESMGELQKGESLLRQFAYEIVSGNPDTEAIFRLGELYGAVRTVTTVCDNQITDDYAVRNTEMLIKTTKYLEEIIMLLYEQHSMTHSEMAFALGLKIPTLTECMKKILNTNLIYARQSGRYKVYSLTDNGYRYAQRKKKSATSESVSIFSEVNKKYENRDSYIEKWLDEREASQSRRKEINVLKVCSMATPLMKKNDSASYMYNRNAIQNNNFMEEYVYAEN